METKSDSVALPNVLNGLRWSALVFGIVVNLWALWVILPEVGKELFRFGQLPNVSSSTGFFDWIKNVVQLDWLPKDAIHIHLSRKFIFAACNAALLFVVFNFYARGRRRLAITVGSLVLVTLFLVFSPVVGNL